MTSRRCCKNSPDAFWYICGKFTYSSERKEISDFIKKVYLAYFGIPLRDQDYPWPPHAVCSICYSLLHAWTNKKPIRHLRFGIPMVWREPSNHNTDCYFCLVETKGFREENRHKIEYQSLPSAILSVPHSDLQPAPVFRELPPLQVKPFHTLQQNSDQDTLQSDSEIQMDDQFDVNTDDSCISAESDSEHSQEPSTHISQSLPQTINQIELNDLIRDLNLSKNQSQILASRLKEKNLLTHGTSISYCKSRGSSFRQFFKVGDSFVFCANVESVLVELGIENYDASE